MATILPSRARPATPWSARRADDDYGAPASPDWRDVDWRDHLRETSVGGRRVNYVDVGEGPGAPVVFIHGLGGNWQNWLENIPAAARERRVVAMDLPGFGDSEAAQCEVSISNYARFIDELCGKLELPGVVLVGNSMGGFIGAETAIAFPARAERLVLVAAAGLSITNLRRRPVVTAARVEAAIAARTAVRQSPETLVLRPRLRHLALAWVFRHPSRLRPELLYEVVSGAGKDGFMPALEALLGYDFRDRLPEIGCPTLIVWGAEDMLVPVKDADEFERLIEDSRKVVMKDTGHCPMIERPRSFNRYLAEFLAEGPAADESRDSVETAAADETAEAA